MKIGKQVKNPITERRKAQANNPKPLDYGRTKHKANKGLLNGSCNREACQAPGANFFNYGTERYYCRRCADDLNFHNRKWAHDMYGHDLCLEETVRVILK